MQQGAAVLTGKGRIASDENIDATAYFTVGWEIPRNCLFPERSGPHLMHSFGPTRVHNPNGNSIGSSDLVEVTVVTSTKQTDVRRTDRQTHTHRRTHTFNNRPHLAHVLRCGLKVSCYVLTSIDNEPADIAVDAVCLTIVTNCSFVIITSLPSRWDVKYCDQRVWMPVFS